MRSIRFRPLVWDTSDYPPVEVCEHITLSNAYFEENDHYEYGSNVQVECKECNETYEYRLKIN